MCIRDRYILGPEVSAFEAEFAAYLGLEHAVGVASGTDAVLLALRDTLPNLNIGIHSVVSVFSVCLLYTSRCV